MKNGYSKFLTIVLIIIVIAVIGLLGYLGYDFYSKYRVKKDAEQSVDAYVSGSTVDAPSGDSSGTGGTVNNSSSNDVATTDGDVEGSGSSSKKRKKLYKGFYMSGTIEIPKTNVKYPILEKVTKRSLETAVAIVWPEKAELNKVGNVVIVGHNYRNGVFFSNNKKLSKGDKIYITDYEGKRMAYSIYKIFEATETDTSFYNRDTDGKREITLSTCTDDASRRLIIQASE